LRFSVTIDAAGCVLANILAGRNYKIQWRTPFRATRVFFDLSLVGDSPPKRRASKLVVEYSFETWIRQCSNTDVESFNEDYPWKWPGSDISLTLILQKTAFFY
jgi:hypothetical protein